MALRKASSYSKKKARPYTRKSKNKSKSYIKVIPHNKVVKYHLGNSEGYFGGKFKHTVRFVSEERVQIRDNAIESGRLLLNKILEKKLPKQFYFEIRIYPHHILRNNKTAAGAGADRLSSGMKHSFGITEGRAAMVNPGKDIFFVATENEHGAKIARETMAMIKAKMPCRGRIIYSKID